MGTLKLKNERLKGIDFGVFINKCGLHAVRE